LTSSIWVGQSFCSSSEPTKAPPSKIFVDAMVTETFATGWGTQRPVFIYTSLPLGVKIRPSGQSSPLRSTPGVNSLESLVCRMVGRTKDLHPLRQLHPKVTMFTPGVQSSPLGAWLKIVLNSFYELVLSLFYGQTSVTVQ
jgi:hypothetical protein